MADLTVDSNLAGSIDSNLSGAIDSNLSGAVDSNLSGALSTTVSGTFGAVGPVTLAGIPDTYTFHIKEIPKIQFSVDPVTTNISIKEIPSVRAHLPANYAVGFSIFGIEVAAVRLCGEGQIITEPYQPNPCEVCGRVASTGIAIDLAPGRTPQQG
jgi:hypothetical protein